MRRSTIARASAAFTAAALALTLSGGPASAADSTSARADSAATSPTGDRTSGFSAASVAPAVAGDATLKKFVLASSVITERANSYAKGAILFNLASGVTLATFAEADAAGLPPARARFTVNGKVKSEAHTIWVSRGGESYPGADIPRTWGSGKVRIDNIHIATKKGGTVSETPVAGTSNTFYARKDIKTMRADGIALTIKRKDKKVTFKARQIKIVNPSTGTYVSAGRVKLQYKSGGKWRTKKTIKLDSKGNGSYSRTTSTKYRYRLYIAKTSNSVQFRTRQTGKI